MAITLNKSLSLHHLKTNKNFVAVYSTNPGETIIFSRGFDIIGEIDAYYSTRQASDAINERGATEGLSEIVINENERVVVLPFIDANLLLYLQDKILEAGIYFTAAGIAKQQLGPNFRGISLATFVVSHLLLNDFMGPQDENTKSNFMYLIDKIADFFVAAVHKESNIEKYKYFSEAQNDNTRDRREQVKKLRKEGADKDYYAVVLTSDKPDEQDIVLGEFNNSLELLQWLLQNKSIKNPLQIYKEYITSSQEIGREFIFGLIAEEEVKKTLEFIEEKVEETIYKYIRYIIREVPVSFIYYDPIFYINTYFYYKIIEYGKNVDLDELTASYNTYAQVIKETYFTLLEKPGKRPRINHKAHYDFLKILLKHYVYDYAAGNKDVYEHITKNMQEILNQNDDESQLDNEYKVFLFELRLTYDFVTASEKTKLEFSEEKKKIIKEKIYDNIVEYITSNIGLSDVNDMYEVVRTYYNMAISDAGKHINYNGKFDSLFMKKPELIFPLMLYIVFNNISKKVITNRNRIFISGRQKGKRGRAFSYAVLSTGEYGDEKGLLIANIINENHYGTKLILDIISFIIKAIYKDPDMTSISYNDAIIPIDRKTALDIANKFYEYVKSLDRERVSYLDIEKTNAYHAFLRAKSSTYNAVSLLYDMMHDRKTLLEANLYEHQKNTSDKICAAYSRAIKQNTSEGFLLSHATGSGKTITIAKSLDCIWDQTPEAKVLIISKGEIIDKILSEMPAISKNYRESFVVSSIDEFEAFMQEAKGKGLSHHQVIAISFTLLAQITNDRELMVQIAEELDEEEAENIQTLVEQAFGGESKEEEEDEEEDSAETGNIDIYKEVQIKGSKKRSVDVMQAVEFIRMFDVVVVDEAHYIKNLNLMSLDKKAQVTRKRGYSPVSSVFGVNLHSFGYVAGPGISKVALVLFLSKFWNNKTIYKNLRTNTYSGHPHVRDKYEEIHLDNKNIFYILSSGTFMANYPHDIWINLYLAYGNTNEITLAPYDMAVDFFRAERSGSTVTYTGHIQEVALAMKNNAAENTVEQIIKSFESKLFSDLYSKLIAEGYLDVFSEKDATAKGLLKSPEKRIIKYQLREEIESMARNIMNFTEEFSKIHDLERNIKDYEDLVKAILLIMKEKENEEKRKRSRVVSGRSNRIPNVNLEIKGENNTIITSYGLSLQNILFGGASDAKSGLFANIEEMLRVIAENQEIPYKELIDAFQKTLYGVSLEITLNDGRKVFIARDQAQRKLEPSYERLVSTSHGFVLYPGVMRVKAVGGKQAQSSVMGAVAKALRALISSVLLRAKDLAVNKTAEIVKTLMTDYINLYVDTHTGKVKGESKIMITSSYIMSSVFIYFAFAELCYVMFVAPQKEKVVLTDKIKEISNRILELSIGYNAALSMHRGTGLDAYQYLKVIMPIISAINRTYESFQKNVIDNIILTDGQIDTSSVTTTTFIKTVQFISDNLALYRILKYIFAFSRLTKAEHEKRIMDKMIYYWANTMYHLYGSRFFEETDKYVQGYIGTIVQGDVEGLRTKFIHFVDASKIDSEIKNKGFLDYLVGQKIIPLQMKYNIIEKIKNKAFSSNKDKLEQKMYSIIDKLLEYKGRGTSYVKNRISELFSEVPDLKVVVANMKAVAEGLNFSNASALYLLDLPWQSGLLSQIEARVNRANSKYDMTINYIVSDLEHEVMRTYYVGAKDIMAQANTGMGKEIAQKLFSSSGTKTIYEDIHEKLNMIIEALKENPIVEKEIKIHTNTVDIFVEIDKSNINMDFVYEATKEAVDDLEQEAESIEKGKIAGSKWEQEQSDEFKGGSEFNI